MVDFAQLPQSSEQLLKIQVMVSVEIPCSKIQLGTFLAMHKPQDRQPPSSAKIIINFILAIQASNVSWPNFPAKIALKIDKIVKAPAPAAYELMTFSLYTQHHHHLYISAHCCQIRASEHELVIAGAPAELK